MLWTTRTGSEQHLLDELQARKVPARLIAPGLVAAQRVAELEPAFARQGLPVVALLPPDGTAIAAALAPRLGRTFALHVWVADTDQANPLSRRLPTLESAVLAALPPEVRSHHTADAVAAREAGGLLAQVCMLSPEQVAVGVQRALDAHSLAPGGRLRIHADRNAPARSAMKLAEALAWLGRSPEPGDVCVDLGAAPGGWTYVLHSRRAHVVAVDPGKLAPNLRNIRGIEHLPMNAFLFEPEIPADWLFCDMAWRPLEVAALLAKWGRKHWARFLVANIKLPMQRRADVLRRVLEIIATGGWTGVRARQLYHDRDEVTVAAWRGFGGDTRPPALQKAKSPRRG